MSEYILGIHFGHDATATLMKEGEVVEAMQEERLSRIKKYVGFPDLAVKYIKEKYKIDNFQEFWLSPDTDERRKKVDALRVPVWMVCTARTALYNHPFAVGWWILKNKFFGFNIQ